MLSDNVKKQRNISYLMNEITELTRFKNFLVETGRVKTIGQYERKPNELHVLEDFTSIARPNKKETIDHFADINDKHKPYRENALVSKRDQASLDAILLFKGTENKELFPEKIRKILAREYERNPEKGIHITKLPAYHKSFSPKSRLVYTTSLSLTEGINEFEEQIKKPLNLKKLTPFTFQSKTSSNGQGLNYFQANTHHKIDTYHTYISIRSLTR